MDTVVLAGGLGTRMREETEYRPKPMVQVGGQPVLWHILRNLATFGLNDFNIAMGYKAEAIQDYFLNYAARTRDVTISLGSNPTVRCLSEPLHEDWNVTLLNTGEDATTADRVMTVAERVRLSETFLVVYGDGLANVDISKLTAAHAKSGSLATVTVVQHQSRFGIVDLGSNGKVSRFREKPLLDNFVSIGFVLFERQALDAFQPGESLEEGPLARLAGQGQLSAFIHGGFWEPMDTYREYLHLNSLWAEGEAPWMTWVP